MRNYIILMAWLLGLGAIAQTTPGIEWQHSYGSTHDDHAWSVQQTNDGGYIMAGDVRGNSGNVSGYHGGDFDAWVVKLDAQGNLDWQRSLGGSGSEGAQSIIQSSDGGYLVTGGTNSTDGDVGVNHGGWDAWVVKLDSEGNVTWARTYGGLNDDGAWSICQTNDGGYVISGDSRSIDGEVTGNHGGPDCWVVKLNEVGELQWQRSLGGSGYDASYSIKQANDGGYILAGETSSNDGDVSGNHGGDGIDWWVVKLDGDGIMEWQKTLGGTGNDVASSVQQINDGGYIVVGEVDSDDGDVTGYHGGGDFWAAKLNSIGEVQWQQCYGGSSLDRAEGIQEVADDGFIIAGYTRSVDGQVTNYHGGQFGDAWLIRISNTGDLIWEKTMGGSGTDKAFAIEKTLGAGYIVAGYSNSSDGDVTDNHGGQDCWVVKLGPDGVGIAELQNPVAFSLFPNPSTDAVNIQFNSPSNAMVQIQLLDDAGKMVVPTMEERIPSGQQTMRYSVAALPAGVYELRLTTGGKVFTRSLVKL